MQEHSKKPLSKLALGSFILTIVFVILMFIAQIAKQSSVKMTVSALLIYMAPTILLLGISALWKSKESSPASQILATIGIIFGGLAVFIACREITTFSMW